MQSNIRWLALLCGAAFPIAARAELQTNYQLNLSGTMDGNPFNSSLSLDNDLQVTGVNMNMTGELFRADVGDVSANWDNLGFAQRSFRGMSLNVPTGKVETTIVGGSLVTYDLNGRQRSSPIYGVRAALPLAKAWRLNVAQLFTPGAADGDGKSITSLGLNFQPSARTNLGMEYVRSGAGGGWQLTGAHQTGRLAVQASYRQTQSAFSSTSNSSSNSGVGLNRSGGFFSLRYKIAKPLSASFSMQRYTDGASGYSRYTSAQLQYSKPKGPALTLFWRSSDQFRPQQLRSDGESTRPASGFAAQSVGLRLSQAFHSTRVAFQYDRLNFLSHSGYDSNGVTDRFGLRLTRPLGRKTSLSFQQVLALRRSEQSGESERLGDTQLVVSRRIGHSGMQVDLGFDHQFRSASGRSGQSLGLIAGLNLPLGDSNSFSVQYRPSLIASGSTSSFAPDRLYLGFTHRMGGGGRGSKSSFQARKLLGQIAGRVFEDLNGNGKYDSGEPGVAGIEVALGSHRQLTDAQGRFNIPEISTGDYRLQMVVKTLPIEFTTMTPTEAPMQIAPGAKAAMDFAVARTGQAKGVVFRDENRNGVQDKGEPGIAGAVVRVEDSPIISFADAQGKFTLWNLPPRRWKISVDAAALSTPLTATGQGFAEVNVPANGAQDGVALGVAPPEKAVENTFTSEK